MKQEKKTMGQATKKHTGKLNEPIMISKLALAVYMDQLGFRC